MSNKCFFDTIPKGGLIFLDACALCLPHYLFYSKAGLKNYGHSWHEMPLPLVEETTARLSILNTRLEEWDNWLTIPRVLEEIAQGNYKLLRTIKETPNDERRVLLLKLLSGRLRATETLENLRANAKSPENNTGDFYRKWRSSKKEIIPYFKRNGGKGSARTDIDFIAANLAYAEDSPTYPFSMDRAIQKTLAELAITGNGDYQPMKIIDEQHKRIVDPVEYLEDPR